MRTMDILSTQLPEALQCPERVFVPPEGTGWLSFALDPDDRRSCFVFYFTPTAEDNIKGRRVHAIDHFVVPDDSRTFKDIESALRYVALLNKSIKYCDGNVKFIYDEEYFVQQEVASRFRDSDGDTYTATYERKRNVDEGAECFFSHEGSLRPEFLYSDWRVIEWHEGMGAASNERARGSWLAGAGAGDRGARIGYRLVIARPRNDFTSDQICRQQTSSLHLLP